MSKPKLTAEQRKVLKRMGSGWTLCFQGDETQQTYLRKDGRANIPVSRDIIQELHALKYVKVVYLTWNAARLEIARAGTVALTPPQRQKGKRG